MSKRASPQAAPQGVRGRTDAPRREPHVGCDGCLARHLSVCASLPQEETRDLEAAAGKLRLPAEAMALAELRGQGDATPIVMLTAKGDEIDRIVGHDIDHPRGRAFKARGFVVEKIVHGRPPKGRPPKAWVGTARLMTAPK